MSTLNRPDHPGRSRQALGEIFDGIKTDIEAQWAKQAAAQQSPAPSEPMLGAMGAIPNN